MNLYIFFYIYLSSLREDVFDTVSVEEVRLDKLI